MIQQFCKGRPTKEVEVFQLNGGRKNSNPEGEKQIVVFLRQSIFKQTKHRRKLIRNEMKRKENKFSYEALQDTTVICAYTLSKQYITHGKLQCTLRFSNYVTVLNNAIEQLMHWFRLT